MRQTEGMSESKDQMAPLGRTGSKTEADASETLVQVEVKPQRQACSESTLITKEQGHSLTQVWMVLVRGVRLQRHSAKEVSGHPRQPFR
jgi:hypothetical protein